MRRAPLIACVVAAVAFAAVIVARPDVAQGQTDLHYVVRYATSTVEEVRHGDGLGFGDRLVIRSPLFEGTDVVGSVYWDCVAVKGGARRVRLWLCDAALKVQGGGIFLEHLDVPGPSETPATVVGGTGTYGGATGEATLTDVARRTDIVIHLDA